MVSQSSNDATLPRLTDNKDVAAAVDLYDDVGNSTKTSTDQLSTKEKLSLLYLVMGYACTMSSTTLMIGTLPLVVLSVGGSRQIAPVAMGTIFLGSAGISLVTTYIFTRWGRKVGFLVGALSGIMGAAISAVAIIMRSPGLAILGGFPIGAGNGIGMYVRFAAVEVVSLESYHSMAVTLVLSGGVIAAFAGPESAQLATSRNNHLVDADSEQHNPLLGIMVVATVFYFANAVFVSLVSYPRMSSPSQEDIDARDSKITLLSLLKRRSFWVPAAVASLCWAIMAMPMSLVRVAMKDVGYTQRQSLTTIELHFVGMFAPGLAITGILLSKFGPRSTASISVLVFAMGIALGLVSRSEHDGTSSTWIFSLILLGIGWNFGFSGVTVVLTKEAYSSAPHLKPNIQAANDFIMFLFAGVGIIFTGYIYKAGGIGLNGWRTLNCVVTGLNVLLTCIFASELYSHSQARGLESHASDTLIEEQVRLEELKNQCTPLVNYSACE